MKQKTSVILLLTGLTLFTSACASNNTNRKTGVLTIQEQGSFMVGGTSFSEPGKFDLTNSLKSQGQTFHGDHAYVSYHIQIKARKYPLVFLHGAAESKKTWESTPDGREGFQTIFLRRGFGVYLLDQPRRGEAGKSLVTATIPPTPDEQFWFTQFRIGNYPDYFDGSQFPRDTALIPT